MALSSQVGFVFEFTQSSPSDTWVIAHNLGRYPAIDVFINFNGGVQRILPLSVTYDNANQCTVTFTAAQSGFATVA